MLYTNRGNNMKDKSDIIIALLLTIGVILSQLNIHSLQNRVTLLEDVTLNLDKRILTCEQALLSQNDINKAQLDWNTYIQLNIENIRANMLTKRKGKVL